MLLGGVAGLVRSLTHVYASAEVVPTPANAEVLAPRLAERVLLIVVDAFYGPFVDVGFLLFFLIFVATSTVLHVVTSVRGQGAHDTMSAQ